MDDANRGLARLGVSNRSPEIKIIFNDDDGIAWQGKRIHELLNLRKNQTGFH